MAAAYAPTQATLIEWPQPAATRPLQATGPARIGPAPPETARTLGLAPDKAVKDAIEAYREVRAEWRALVEAKAPAKKIEDKNGQLATVQKWAIEAATENRDKLAAEEAEASSLFVKIQDDLVATIRPENRAARNDAFNRYEASRVAFDLAKQKRMDAEDLLDRANGTASGNLRTAQDYLPKAQDRYVAADMKLKAAQRQPKPDKNIVEAAQKEFDKAAKERAAAELELRRAEQVWDDYQKHNHGQ